MVTENDVVEALHGVEDPELGMDIVEIGLFYEAQIDGPSVKIIHSLTSMGCPAGPMIQEGIHDAVAALPGCRERRGGADVRSAVDARPDVGRREVHSRLRIGSLEPFRGLVSEHGSEILRRRRPSPGTSLPHGLNWWEGRTG